MGTLKKLIGDVSDGKPIAHYLALSSALCKVIEKLHTEGKCSEDLWYAYSHFDKDPNKRAITKISEAVMRYIDYLDEHEDELPSEMKAIINDFKEKLIKK